MHNNPLPHSHKKSFPHREAFILPYTRFSPLFFRIRLTELGVWN